MKDGGPAGDSTRPSPHLVAVAVGIVSLILAAAALYALSLALDAAIEKARGLRAAFRRRAWEERCRPGFPVLASEPRAPANPAELKRPASVAPRAATGRAAGKTPAADTPPRLLNAPVSCSTLQTASPVRATAPAA